ncbi:MAG: low molecular weight phosphatase family protein [Halobacteriales archaeon]
MSFPLVRMARGFVQNAGRSQMATAFAHQAQRHRGLEDEVEIRTGGTQPADDVHDLVVAVVEEAGIDLGDRTPRAIAPDELADTNNVVTMGWAPAERCRAAWAGENRDWTLDDPDGRDPDAGRTIRDEVGRRVRTLFDEIEREVTPRV